MCIRSHISAYNFHSRCDLSTEDMKLATLCKRTVVRESLSDNSLFVGKLQEDKSLALRARDLIFFTTDLQMNNSLLELIYFLNK